MKATFMLLGVALLGSTSQAQEVSADIKPLHRFMQANADSTIALSHEGGWSLHPSYLLISKKQDTITCYTYRYSYNFYNGQLPVKIRSALLDLAIKAVPKEVEVNTSFQPYLVNADSLRFFWKELNRRKPWSLLDDSQIKNTCSIKLTDGTSIKLFLITSGDIKVLNFYEPAFFEEHCPGNKDRVSILELQALFNRYFVISSK